jgi:hypothetical protein
MIDVLTLLGAIQTSIDCAKGVSEGLKAIKEVEQQLAFLEMKRQQMELINSLLEAKDKIRDLHGQLVLQEQMEHQQDGNIMWRVQGQKRHGPYCSTCYGDQGKLIFLSGDDSGARHCPKCKNHFFTKQWHVDQREKIRNLDIGYRRH